jgi:putative SOS response-associated peptidase YedK
VAERVQAATLQLFIRLGSRRRSGSEYEFTGASYPKTKHRFALNDAPCMAIAGIWRPGTGNQPETFAMLTKRRART